jgi:transposase InsO family protein
MVKIQRVFDENLFVYGADRVWTQLNRENIRVARCTVERLMRHMGLCGARRGKAFTVTTTSDDRLARPLDLVDRKFKAPPHPRRDHHRRQLHNTSRTRSKVLQSNTDDQTSRNPMTRAVIQPGGTPIDYDG